jgi:hypothetical protein
MCPDSGGTSACTIQYHDHKFPAKSISKIVQEVREAPGDVHALAAEGGVLGPLVLLVDHLLLVALQREQRLPLGLVCEATGSGSGEVSRGSGEGCMGGERIERRVLEE